MQQFVIHLENSDALAKIGKALGQQDIDIVSMAGTSAFGVCTAVLFTDNIKGTINVLKKLNIPFSTQDILIASIPDEPGSFGHFTQLFKDQGIRLLSFYVLRFIAKNAEIALSVDEADFEKAQSFLDVSGFIKSHKKKK
ncbi:MAG: hypothetical protein JSW11_11225 [Candidatus Heimdallarchaeota archaeon]|nr:MAG: hypothetical protein JSW11_11225 [Candidatus Heimdallarchaeota archaeon]